MSDTFSPKERLLRTLQKSPTERPPVICPGGMMNAAIIDVMKATGHTLPNAHSDWRLMSSLAEDVQKLTGFENIGIPFCMTVEAEALGSMINFGTLECEPKIDMERFAGVEDVEYMPIGAIAKSPRAGVVIQSVAELSKHCPDIPVIGSVTGPISTAASIVDPMTFLKQLRKNREISHRVVDYVTDQLIDYVRLLVENGASVISIADPTATGEILGPRFFEDFAVPYLNKLALAVHELDIPVIIHICGDVSMIKPMLAKLRSDALSVDAMVSLQKLKSEFNGVTTMGNVSTYLLQFGKEDAVRKTTQSLVTNGIDIIAPACGLSTSTPLSNIKALTQAVTD
ncbi:MAG TPA: uroporphyrinogen decarboxylase family protein [Syntrophomonas sp.]|nr:uroporphyrinogen decarboxylase family protein [Syntrophomonas sp.]